MRLEDLKPPALQLIALLCGAAITWSASTLVGTVRIGGQAESSRDLRDNLLAERRRELDDIKARLLAAESALRRCPE